MDDFYYQTIGTVLNPATSVEEIETAMCYTPSGSTIYVVSTINGEYIELPEWIIDKANFNDIRIYRV